MANFFTKLFGKSRSQLSGSPENMIQQVLDGIIEKGNFNLSFEITQIPEGFSVNLSGEDAVLVTDREGLLIDSFQIFLKRMLQNKFSQEKIEIEVDCEGFLESSAQELKDLADKLKNNVLEKGQPSYMRALAPRDRKVVHRFLANEPRVRSQSVGEGFCKKIKISVARPATSTSAGKDASAPAQDESFA